MIYSFRVAPLSMCNGYTEVKRFASLVQYLDAVTFHFTISYTFPFAEPEYIMHCTPLDRIRST